MANREIKKPKIGEPCNGCGICCINQVCMNGSYVLKLVNRLGESVPGPCPAIVKHPDGKIDCGIILHPNKYIKSSQYPAKILSKYFAHLIGAGNGCDELLDDDVPEEETKLEEILTQTQNNPQWVEKAQRGIRIIHNL